MNRQYIGARYVPKFSAINGGLWDNTYSYEALEIVKHGNDYYTSKKPVPTGVAITNTEYWVLTGNYNGAIDSLQTQIDEINNVDLPNINSSIQTLTSQFTNWSSHKVIFIGDSYGRRVNENNNKIADIVANNLGCNYVDISKNGIGFTNINGSGTFLQQLQTITSDRDTYTDIVIYGGCNDYDTQTNIEDAISSFCDYAKVNFVNAKIYIAMIGGFNTNHLPNQDNIKNLTLPAYRNCSLYGAHYLANMEYVMYNNSMFENDGIHPTPAGVSKLGVYLTQALMNGYADVNMIIENIPTNNGDANFEVLNINNIYTFIHNDVIGYNFKSLTTCVVHILNFSGAVNNGNFTQTIHKNVKQFGFPQPFSMICSALARDEHFKYYPAKIYVDSNENVGLSVLNLTDSTIEYLQIMPTGQVATSFDITR